ncbi:winged helix-turn-helix transcriptional regulator [Streptomyces atrovirens]|uniref:Winged helix-turn-helix transcriptional regulator n=1 Tax=Streptomyces atrovirens TaxID=285556 RepID=A0ABW0E5B9_9ACTN
MLPDRLAQLGGAGVVERDRRPGRPPRVRYALTPSGHRLDSVFRALRDRGGCPDTRRRSWKFYPKPIDSAHGLLNLINKP